MENLKKKRYLVMWLEDEDLIQLLRLHDDPTEIDSILENRVSKIDL
jgi:hypothetical protein